MGGRLRKIFNSALPIIKTASDRLDASLGEAYRLSGVRKSASDSLNIALAELGRLNGVRKTASDILSVAVGESRSLTKPFTALRSAETLAIALAEARTVSAQSVNIDDPIPVGSLWVDPISGNDANSGSQLSPKKSITGAISAMGTSGGNTVVLKAGTYSGSTNNLSNALSKIGTAAAWNEIRAEVDGTVTITSLLNIYDNRPIYTKFTGLIWNYADDKGITSHYWKFKRCRFVGGRSSGNFVTIGCGTNDFSPGSTYGLFEDCWAYGAGGRYKLLVYNADRIIVRRFLARHDGGWTNVDGNPQGCITFYNSSNCLDQNSIAIDTDSTAWAQNFEAGFYNVCNVSSSNQATSNRHIGCLAIRTGGAGFAWDDHRTALDMGLQDFVIWNDTNGSGFVNNGAPHIVSVSRGLIKSSSDGLDDYNDGGSISCDRLIMYQNANRAMRPGINVTNSISYGNGTNNVGTIYNPIGNGLVYPMRIETGSPLSTYAAGNYIGPQIRNRIGVDGTLWGEPGYNSDTGVSLWPYPYEDIRRAEMRLVSSRGFCANGQTLTGYIANLLGNGNPY